MAGREGGRAGRTWSGAKAKSKVRAEWGKKSPLAGSTLYTEGATATFASWEDSSSWAGQKEQEMGKPDKTHEGH